MKSFETTAVLEDHLGPLTTSSFDPLGNLIATASYDHSVALYAFSGKAAKLTAKMTSHTDNVYDVEFSHDSAKLISCSGDSTIRVWDVARHEHELALHEHSSSVLGVTYMNSGHSLALSCSDDSTVRAWDLRAGRSVHKEVIVCDGPLWGIAASGPYVAVALDEGAVRVLDSRASLKQVKVLEGHTSAVRAVEFSPNGTTLASGADDATVRLWDVAGLSAAGMLRGHETWVNSVRWSSDSNYIVSGSQDTTVIVWDALTMRRNQRLHGHSQGVFDACFSRDGKYIVTASSDITARIWEEGAEPISTGRSSAAPASAHRSDSVGAAFIKKTIAQTASNQVDSDVDDLDDFTQTATHSDIPIQLPKTFRPAIASAAVPMLLPAPTWRPQHNKPPQGSSVYEPQDLVSKALFAKFFEIFRTSVKGGNKPGALNKAFSGGVNYMIVTPGLDNVLKQVGIKLADAFPDLLALPTHLIRGSLTMANNSEIDLFRASILKHPNVLHILVIDNANWGLAQREGSQTARAYVDEGPVSALLGDPETRDAKNFYKLYVSAVPFNLVTQQSRIPPENEVMWKHHCGAVGVDLEYIDPALYRVYPETDLINPQYVPHERICFSQEFENFVRDFEKRSATLPSPPSGPGATLSSRKKEARLQSLVQDYTAAMARVKAELLSTLRNDASLLKDFESTADYNLPFRPATLPTPTTLHMVRRLLRIHHGTEVPDEAGTMIVIRIAGVTAGLRLRNALREARNTVGLKNQFEVLTDTDLAKAGLEAAIENQPLLHVMRHVNGGKIPQTFADLAGLPCIFILCEHGREGDVFPSTCHYFDLRLRHNVSSPDALVLSSLMVDIGRAARYEKRKRIGHALPLIVLPKVVFDALRLDAPGSKLHDKLFKLKPDSHVEIAENSKAGFFNELSEHATSLRERGFHPELEPLNLEPYRKYTRALRHLDTETHLGTDPRSILLCGPSLCGKTGAYLNFLRLVKEEIKVIPSYGSDDDFHSEVQRTFVEVLPDVSFPVTDEESESQVGWDRWPDVHRMRQCRWIDPGPETANSQVTMSFSPLESGEGDILQNANNDSSGSAPGSGEPGRNRAQLPASLVRISCSPVTPAMRAIGVAEGVQLYGVPFTVGIKTGEWAVLVLPDKAPPVFHGEKLGSLDETNACTKAIKAVQELLHGIVTINGRSDETVRILTDNVEYMGIDPIFVPTSGRARQGFFDISRSIRESAYTQILVVQRSEIAEYMLHRKRHIFLVVPDQRGSNAGRSAGYVRHCVQALAYSLGLEFIFMMDDNVIGFQELHIKGDPHSFNYVLDGDEKSDQSHIPPAQTHLGEGLLMGRVLRHVQRDRSKGDYALVGFLRNGLWIDHGKINHPYSYAFGRALFYLNVKKTVENQVLFDPKLSTGEDTAFARECAARGLLMVRYNRFVIHKAAGLAGGRIVANE